MKGLRKRINDTHRRASAVLEVIRMSHHKKTPSVKNAVKLLILAGISVKAWKSVLEQLKHINNDERILNDDELSGKYGKRDNQFLNNVLKELEKNGR